MQEMDRERIRESEMQGEGIRESENQRCRERIRDAGREGHVERAT